MTTSPAIGERLQDRKIVFAPPLRPRALVKWRRPAGSVRITASFNSTFFSSTI
jgi:hypothetical protein